MEIEFDKYDTFILKWNIQYPYDRRWRKKYNVSFGSEQHLTTSHIDMAFDLREDDLFKRLQEQAEDNDLKNLKTEKDDSLLKLAQGMKFLAGGENQEGKVITPTKKEILRDYDELDLDKFDEMLKSNIDA